MLLHFLDVSGEVGRNPVDDFYAINNELKKYSEKLAKRKQIIVANKMDVVNDEILKQVEELAKKESLELFKISGATKQGVDELIDYVEKTLQTLPKEDLIEYEDRKVYTLEDEEKWTIKKEDGVFIVSGKAIQRLMGRVNIEDNESIYYLQNCQITMFIHLF